jgi:hypothetical protein
MASRHLTDSFKKILFALTLCSTSLCNAPVLAQSLDINKPDPLKPGINTATADSTVGTQYWYYIGDPGQHTVKVTFQSMGALGAPLKNTLLVTLASPLGAEKKSITSQNEQESVSFTGSMNKATKMVLQIDPLSPTGLVRQGGDYQIEVTGAVHFDAGPRGGGMANPYMPVDGGSGQQDPVVRAYMCMQNDHGITKFLANGTVTGADGSVGTWKLEDADSKAYTVKLGQDRLSLIFSPGRGLVDATSKDVLIFKQLR